jgi:outer membrane beta-barrel protein
MKRAAIGLCACLASVPMLGGRYALADEKEAQPPGGEQPAEAPAEAPAAEPPAAEPPREGQTKTPLEEAKPGAATRWQDIFVVPRRPVLKRKRVELIPTYNVSFNNSLIRHHGFGGMLNVYLSEAFFIGLEGTYYLKQLTDRYYLLGVDQRVIPSVNRYVWSALLDFGYIPLHGKFTFFNSSIAHWEVFASLGVGVFQAEVIPRDPANGGFSKYLVSGQISLGSRLWLARWFSIDIYVKDYLFNDQLEPVTRVAGDTPDPVTGKCTAASGCASDNAESRFTNNVVFGVGVSLFLPPGFEYKLPR